MRPTNNTKLCKLDKDSFAAKMDELTRGKLEELRELTQDDKVAKVLINGSFNHYFEHDNTIYLEI